MYNESIKNSFTLTFDSWTTDRETVDTGREYQLDIGSSSDINSQKYLIAVHQKQTRSGTAYKASITAIFDHLDVKKYFVEINEIRYPKDAIDVEYEKNTYLNQYREFKLFYKRYVGEDFLNPFITYPDLKDFMKKYTFKNDTMNESELQKLSNYPICPRDS